MYVHGLHPLTGAVIPRRLDSIQLPPDESPEALDADSRAVVASVWAERASSELQASLAFNAIASRLVATNAPPDVQYLAARAVSDEVRHASLCLSLAQRYGSTAGWPRAMPADGDDATDLLVLGTCCVNESLGTAFLDATLKRTTAPAVLFVVQSLLADEVDHGRIGWAHLAGMTDPQRAAIGRTLPALLEACLRPWRTRLRVLPVEGVPEHGVLEPRDIRNVLNEALLTLVLPGFDHVGVNIDKGAEWLGAGIT